MTEEVSEADLAREKAVVSPAGSGAPADQPRMLFGPLENEPIDTRRFRPVRILGRDRNVLTVDDFCYWGEVGRLEIAPSSVCRLELLGTTSKVPEFFARRARGASGSEAPALYHTGILYHLDPPARFFLKASDGSFGSKVEVIDRIVSVGNAVGPPGIKFSAKSSANRLMALVLRLMSLDDFLYEEGFKLRNRVRHIPAAFDSLSQPRDILDLAIEYGHQNHYSVEYKWIAGPNCHSWTRHVIDPVVRYHGPFSHMGPLDLPSYLQTRGILNRDQAVLADFAINRKDPMYAEIDRRFKRRVNAPEYAWARGYKPPELHGLTSTRLGNFLTLIVEGKYNPYRRTTKAIRERYGKGRR